MSFQFRSVTAKLCKALEIGDTHNAVGRLDEDEKDVASIYTLGGDQNMAIVNESGLYSLVLRSRKPEAKTFIRWIIHAVFRTPVSIQGVRLVMMKRNLNLTECQG